jgi:hypothetical protein
VKSFPVLAVTSPVVETAEADVNRASSADTLPVIVLKGNDKNTQPMRI